MRGHSTQQGEQTSSITTARKLKYFSFHLRLITILHGYLPVHSEWETTGGGNLTYNTGSHHLPHRTKRPRVTEKIGLRWQQNKQA